MITGKRCSKSPGYFTSLETMCLTYQYAYFIAVHTWEDLENKVLQCSHWILGKTKILHVHIVTAYSRKMFSLSPTHLATLWTLAWITLGWWAYRILTWSPEERWRRYNMERSDTPHNPVSSTLVSGGYFLLVYGRVPPTCLHLIPTSHAMNAPWFGVRGEC